MGNVLYGMENTHNVTLDTMINHGISVKKGIKKSLLVIDMPKNTYNNLLKTVQCCQYIKYELYTFIKNVSVLLRE